MSFIKKWDIQDISNQLRRIAHEVSDPRHDGWTARGCKHELYQVKCLIEDIYQKLPNFQGEEEWEKERVVELLKRK
jgi:hypothetical protein